MANAVVVVRVASELPPASVQNTLITEAGDSPQSVARRLSTFFGSIAGGVGASKLIVRVDSSTPVAASIAVTCDQSVATAGDVLKIGGISFTAKASGAVASAGEFDIGASSSAMATNLAAAINAQANSARRYSASPNSAVVTVSSLTPGAAGNTIPVSKAVTSANALTFTGTTFAGGKSLLGSAAPTVTLDQSKLTANDTLKIGAVTLTWKASASLEGEVTIGASSTAAGDNLVSKINAHSKLQGLFTAANLSGVVTITYLGAGREGALIGLTKTENTSNAMVLSTSDFSSGATDAYGGAGVAYANGLQ